MTFNQKIISVVVVIVLGLVGMYLITHRSDNVAGVSAPVSPPTNVSNLIASENVGSPLFQFMGTTLGPGGTPPLPIASTTATTTPMILATTTPCALQNPFVATSSFTFDLNTSAGTSSIAVFTVSTSSTQYATTSSATTFGISANALSSFHYPGGASGVVGPGGWVVLGLAAGSNGGTNYAYTIPGRCQAIFTSMF